MMSGTSLNLKDGAYFFLIFPLNASATKKFSCKMLLQPVSYILVDGSAQAGKMEYRILALTYIREQEEAFRFQ